MDALHHPDFHATLRCALQLNDIHEVADEEDAAAARFEEILWCQRVSQVCGIESFALVPNADGQFRDPLNGFEFDEDVLVFIVPVSVFDGVDDRLANGHAHPVSGIVVQPDAARHVIAHNLHEIQHVEGAGELEPDDVVTVSRHTPPFNTIRSTRYMPPFAVATITPARRLHGRLHVPGDKSISHRYAMLAALADGTSRLTRYAPGADCQSTLTCLRQLGIDIQEGPAGTLTLLGRGLGHLRSPGRPLDAGNSGTTMRLLAGILAGQEFRAILTGDASLSRRPMRRIIDPLERMGARIECEAGRPPLTVHGGKLSAIQHRPDVPSAQVKSAVLLAGLHAEGTTSVVEPAATRDHTERALVAFGGEATSDGLTVSVAGRQRLSAQLLSVPGDFSSAAFWLVAAAALPGSRIEVEDVGINPTRTALVGVLRRFGARVEVDMTGHDAGEPRGTITVEGTGRGSVEIAPAEVPALIDELPAIAALGAHGGEVAVRGAAELRVKESDRIAALVAGFRALGIDADEHADGFTVHRPAVDGRTQRPRGGTADAQGDHRMAMAFAIAALGADQPSTILGADAVAISYPDFFETLGRLVV
jgi:3-phosphoshikimate 1-carboxyvinyltransferase